MKLHRSRTHRRGRIEIIPMIDVMFFLLATFMLASLSMQNLHSLRVDLPSGHADPMALKRPVTLTVTKEGQLLVNEAPVTPETLGPQLKAMDLAPDTTVIVSADRGAPNGVVVQAMLQARDVGLTRFTIAVRRE